MHVSAAPYPGPAPSGRRGMVKSRLRPLAPRRFYGQSTARRGRTCAVTVRGAGARPAPRAATRGCRSLRAGTAPRSDGDQVRRALLDAAAVSRRRRPNPIRHTAGNAAAAASSMRGEPQCGVRTRRRAAGRYAACRSNGRATIALLEKVRSQLEGELGSASRLRSYSRPTPETPRMAATRPRWTRRRRTCRRLATMRPYWSSSRRGPPPARSIVAVRRRATSSIGLP